MNFKGLRSKGPQNKKQGAVNPTFKMHALLEPSPLKNDDCEKS